MRRSVCTSDPVDFAAGERVVLASSDFDPSHAEEADVKTVLNSTCFETNAAFQWLHSGTRIPGASLSWDSYVDLRAEVGLISRSKYTQSR